MKLHQVLAIESGIRKQSQEDLTEVHKKMQKHELTQGLERTYHPVKEDGERLPSEKQLLQIRAQDEIKDMLKRLQRVFDITATRDYANTKAVADIVVDGKVLIPEVPATFLLWLEKRLDDLYTFVTKLPALPIDTEWEWDEGLLCFRNKGELKTVRTQKVPYALVLLEPTKEHPGQAVEKARDEVVGHWITRRFSGAIHRSRIVELQDRVEKLRTAVKFAREEANSVEIAEKKVGEAILSYVFGATT